MDKAEREDFYKERLRSQALIDLMDGAVVEYDVCRDCLKIYVKGKENSPQIYESYHAYVAKEVARRIHPADRERLYKKVLKEEDKAPIEFRNLTDEGEYAWYRLTSRRLYDEEGSFWKIMGILKNIEQEKQLLQEYQKDALTGAYNRRYLESGLGRYFRRKPQNALCALLMIDIDNFKVLNDTLGHAAGDKVLKKLVDIVKHSFRKDDDICRLGGDEFLIVMKDVYEEEVVVRKAERLIEAFSEYAKGFHLLPPLSISVGISLVEKEEELAEGIYGCADAALYEAKRKGKNTYCVCDKKEIR